MTRGAPASWITAGTRSSTGTSSAGTRHGDEGVRARQERSLARPSSPPSVATVEKRRGAHPRIRRTVDADRELERRVALTHTRSHAVTSIRGYAREVPKRWRSRSRTRRRTRVNGRPRERQRCGG
jgi:hypothetical protein